MCVRAGGGGKEEEVHFVSWGGQRVDGEPEAVVRVRHSRLVLPRRSFSSSLSGLERRWKNGGRLCARHVVCVSLHNLRGVD